MGWLGWTEEQTLDTTIPAIELAYQSCIDKYVMLGWLKRVEGAEPEKLPPFRPGLLKR